MSRTPRAWFKFQNQSSDQAVAEIHIIDIIGDWVDELINSYWGVKATMTAKAFVEELSRLDASVTTIRVHINSPGGDVFAALNIANALRDQQTSKGRTVETVIDGLAASAASVIAMAGSKVSMADNALLMIHNPWSVAMGTAADMRKQAETLDTVRNTIVSTYQWHSELEDADIVALLDAETWMDASQALEKGFVTDVLAGLQAAASIDPCGMSSLAVPEQYRARVAAFVKAAPAPEPAASAVEVIRVCNEAGFPAMAEQFVNQGSRMPEVTAALASAKAAKVASDARAADIRGLCATAGLPELADGYVASAIDVAAVRLHLSTIKAKASPSIDAGLPPEDSTRQRAGIDTSAYYRNFNRSK